MRESSYHSQLQAARQFIEQHDDFLIVSHVNPDGDAISSTCAMGYMLSTLQKSFVMVNENTIPHKFHYLWGSEQIAQWDEHAGHRYSTIITVDCADFSRIGQVESWLSDERVLLNIDHHETNDGYGDVQLIRADAAATGEILYDLAETLNLSWNKELAECIYTGLLTDTGGFRYANTSAKVMKIASHMLDVGCQAAQIADELLEKMSFSQIQLMKLTLASLSFSPSKQIAWVYVTLSDMEQTGAAQEDLEGLVNYPRNIEGVEVGILFKELKNDEVKVSFRSAGRVDVAALAKKLGGGGHVRAAGVTIQGKLHDVILQVTEKVEQRL